MYRNDPDLDTARKLALIALFFNLLGFFLALITVFLAILPFILMFMDYVFIYKPLTDGNAVRAEVPALLLGILQIFVGGVLSGIILIIAWVKIRDSIIKNGGRSSVI
ncbi:hypothetical protein OXIME_000285 [Oxyplasma meridianum]|uniref:Uncharacterized protein n=1 Tax=Oxyplasma meridianum TaxID=3073602 RepID=A0AAX4NEL7_9ARCH